MSAKLAEALPQYMVPRALHPLPVLPTKANGKLDRRALVALSKHARKPGGAGEDAEPQPASRGKEQLVLQTLKSVVGVSASPKDNIGNVGVDSLTLISLSASLKAQGVRVPDDVLMANW